MNKKPARKTARISKPRTALKPQTPKVDAVQTISISELPLSSLKGRKSLPPDVRLGEWESVLQRVPELLRTGKSLASGGYRLVFPSEVMKELRSGALKLKTDAAGQLLPVASASNTGKHVKLGRAVKTGGLRLANVAAATWQIASIITVQQHLSDINARLRRLEDRLGDVHFFQHEEKRAALRASVHLLGQYHTALSRGALHPEEIASIYQKLEDIELECLSIGELAREIGRRELRQLDKIEVKEIRDPRGTAERAKQWINQCHDAVELLVLAQTCRIVACHVKATLPGDHALLEQRIDHAKTEVQKAVEHFASYGRDFLAKVSFPLMPTRGIRKLLNWKNHGAETQRAFNASSTSAREHLQFLEDQAAKTLDLARKLDSTAHAGLAVDFRLNESGAIELLSAEPA